MSRRAYRVVVTREAQDWLADVPELEGTHTWARNLPTLDRHVREAIVLAEDLPETAVDDLDLIYEYHTGDPLVDAKAAEVRALRAELARRERQLVRSTDQVVRELRARGYSVRDVAALSGVSFQRVAQIVGPRRRGSRKKVDA